MGPDARPRRRGSLVHGPRRRRARGLLPPLAGEGIGQVEDVGTLPAARERGLGRAVTLAAAEASAAEGNELTYLGALADDWPRLMYAKLGFEEVGESFIFRRHPPGLASAAG